MKKKRPDIHAQLKRMIKTKSELALLRKSARITDSCVAVLQRELRREGVTEKQLAAAIDRNIRKQRAQLAFPTIVACGKRSVLIHAKPSSKVVRGLGYADFGASWKGYRTDITVPFVKGELGAKEQRMLITTLQAYAALTKMPKRGMPCWMMQDRFDAFLRKRGYATLEIEPERVTARFRSVADVTLANTEVETLKSFVVEAGRPGPISH